MHIAFEAARMLESESTLCLGDYDAVTEPFVDENDQPYVVVSVDNNMLEQTASRMPTNIVVLDRTVLIILKPTTMVMGLH